MRILYLDCFAGISGDMALGAFIDLGVDAAWLEGELKKLGLHGWHMEVAPAEKKGITGTRCHIVLTDEHGHETEDPGLMAPHGHPHSHEEGHHHHGDGHTHGHSEATHSHDHPHEHHSHDHGHEHPHSDHEHHDGHHHHEHTEKTCEHGHHHSHSDSHSHNSYADIRHLIEHSELDAEVKSLALRIFHRIARAEAKIHGKTLETVHFHEVGSVDSIVDIVGTALCVHKLSPDRILCSPVHTGSGFVRCAHGMMPVPAPATLEILTESSLSSYSTNLKGEFTTPTGAAILAEIAAPSPGFPAMKASKVGYGAGHKDFDIPNMLRAVLGETQESARPIRVLEANMDDITGEVAGYALEKLMTNGALDACYTPVVMKKNRPGILLTVLCEPEREAELEALILKETTTLGIRKYTAERTTMTRAVETHETSLGPVRLKTAVWKDITRRTPEYEDCRRIAEDTGLPLQAVMATIMNELKK